MLIPHAVLPRTVLIPHAVPRRACSQAQSAQSAKHAEHKADHFKVLHAAAIKKLADRDEEIKTLKKELKIVPRLQALLARL